MTHCHCSMCRKAHGAAFVTFIEILRSDFRYKRGESLVERYESSPGCQRLFCRCCGSSLRFESVDADEVWLAAGSVDGDPGCRPDSHIFVASRAPWILVEDGLQKFDVDHE